MLNHFNMRCVPIKSSSIGECGFTDFEPWHRQKLKSIAYIILVRFCLLSCRQFSVYLPRSLSREIEQCFQLSFDAVLILNNFISLEVHIIRSLLLLLLLLICGIALMKFNIKVDLNEYVLYVFILNHTTRPMRTMRNPTNISKARIRSKKDVSIWKHNAWEPRVKRVTESPGCVLAVLSDSFSFV